MTEDPKLMNQLHRDIKSLPYQGLISQNEVNDYRQEFPILEQVVHLGNCSQSAQSRRVRQAVNRYLDNWQTVGMDWEAWIEEVDRAKAEFARLIQADVNEIAVASSVSDLVSSIANALDYSGSRNKVVLSDAEFPTVNYVWLANQRRGAQLEFIPLDGSYQVDLDQYRKRIDERTLITSIPQTYYLNGFKQDIVKIAQIARESGSIVMVDAYQSLGTDPVDVKKMGIDILVSGCLKYLFGIPGIAFMYVSDRLIGALEPSVTGWFGQRDPFVFQSRFNDWADQARRFDTGTPPVMNAYAVRAGMEIINEVGPYRIKDRIDFLSAYALQGCLDRQLTVISPFDVSCKSSTTAIVVPEPLSSGWLEKELQTRQIICSSRGPVIRVAPHFYNTKWEIDQALDAIHELLQS